MTEALAPIYRGAPSARIAKIAAGVHYHPRHLHHHLHHLQLVADSRRLC